MKRRVSLCAGIVCAALLVLLSPVVSRAAPALRVTAVHPILPVEPGIEQVISIELLPDGLEAGAERKLQISTATGMGVLQLPGGPASEGEIVCREGESVAVSYRWAGAIPTEQAIEETVTVSAPELGLSAAAEFSIGVNMQVTGIFGAEGAESKVRREIRLVVVDRLHPDADLTAMLQNFNITPEVQVALLRENSNVPVAPVEDPFVTSFLGRRAAPQEVVAFPAAYQRGYLMRREEGGPFEWISVDGQAAGFMAPSGGRYRIRASLKPGTGGVAVREGLSRTFDVAGTSSVGFDDIPGFMGSTVGIVAACTPDALPTLVPGLRDALRQGQSAQAASLLGAAMRGTKAAVPAHVLGRYLETLFAAQPNVEELSPYIQNFLRGYGGHGVLILSRSGVASWRAAGLKGAALTQAPKALSETPSPQARLYIGERLILIPFELGGDFTLTITGSGKGGTSLWKIIPEGVNRKSYPQGDWEKEIAVYTERLQPPAQ